MTTTLSPTGELIITYSARETAFYRTPGGAEVRDSDKRDLVAAGKWIPTVAGKMQTVKRGYQLNAFLLPWMSFGEIAARFLTAKAKGRKALRVFVYEVLCEKFEDRNDAPNDSVLYERQGEYERQGV